MYNCVMKKNDLMKKALETVAAPMYCSAAEIATSDEMEKLSKLITLWTSKNKFFTEETLDQMKNPGTSLNKFRANLAERFRGSVQLVENQIRYAFKENRDEHEKFVRHAQGLIANKQAELDSIERPVVEVGSGSSHMSCKAKKTNVRSKKRDENVKTKDQTVQVPEILLGKAFTEEEKRNSILLMYAGLSSYRLLKSMNLGIKLGGESTVRKWVMNYKCKPGHQNETFVLLQCKVETLMDPLDRNVAIMFDGMATKDVSKWSPSLKTVIPGSSNVNVVLIRGLKCNWKHIVYYDFKKSINRETLETIIIRIQSIGLVVKVLIMDLGNHTIQSELGFSQGARSFKNPSLPGDILIHPDPIHNFKSMRNALLDHGIVFKLDGRDVAVGMEDFRKVLNMQKHGEASMCPKLTEDREASGL